MKRYVTVLLIVVFLTGCSDKSGARPMELLRQKLSQNGCSFSVAMDVDFGNTVSHFAMDCILDQEGMLSFSVTSPETIQGIGGKIHAGEGKLIYDDVILGFPILAQGELSPVCSPWLLCECISEGYLKAFSEEEQGLHVTLEHVFRGEEFRVDVWLGEQNVPVFAEIYWEGSRLVSMHINNFFFL